MAIVMFNTVIRDLTTEEMVDENASVYDDPVLPSSAKPAEMRDDDMPEPAAPVHNEPEEEEMEVRPSRGMADEPAISYEQDGDSEADFSVEDIEALIADRSGSVCSHCGMNDVDQQDGVCDSCYDAEQNTLENEEVAI